MTDSSQEYMARRPAPRVRSAVGIASVQDGLAWNFAAEDPRVAGLALGGTHAIEWVEGMRTTAPLYEGEWPDPTIGDMIDVAATGAAMASGRPLTREQRVTDATRIYGRGIQEILLWWVHLGCRRPLWTIAGVDPDDVITMCVGQVAEDLDLAATHASEHAFPYDPVRRLIPPAGHVP